MVERVSRHNALFFLLLLYGGIWLQPDTRVREVTAAGSDSPLVIFPPQLYWESHNLLYVTPLAQSHGRLDITVTVEEELAANHGLRSQVYSLTLQGRPPRSTTTFDVELPSHSHSAVYYVRVEVENHSAVSTPILGMPNVRSINLQTDKVFYRPGESINIRALPLTNEGSLYTKGEVEFQLLDPNGFKIFNQSAKATNRFISSSFSLPRYLRYGMWRVAAMAKGSRKKFDVRIRVHDYTLPKYQVLLYVQETGDAPTQVKVTVHARFHHGMLVSGNLILRCAVYSDWHENSQQQPKTPQTTHKLLDVQVGGDRFFDLRCGYRGAIVKNDGLCLLSDVMRGLKEGPRGALPVHRLICARAVRRQRDGLY